MELEENNHNQQQRLVVQKQHEQNYLGKSPITQRRTMLRQFKRNIPTKPSPPLQFGNNPPIHQFKAWNNYSTTQKKSKDNTAINDSSNNVVQRMPIFINGRAGNADRASLSYWQTGEGNGLLDVVGERYEQYELGGERDLAEEEEFANSKWAGDYLLLNGDRGFKESTRETAGGTEAGLQAPEIFRRLLLSRNQEGQITERIQVFTHSRGSAFGNGFIQGLRQAILNMAANEEVSFSYGRDNLVEIVVNMAPHGATNINVPKTNTPTISISHEYDPLSSKDVKGDSANILTPSRNGRLGDSHRNSSFVDELGDVLENHQENERNPGINKYDGYNNLLDDQVAYEASENFNSSIELQKSLTSRNFLVTNGSVKITCNGAYAEGTDAKKYTLTLYKSNRFLDDKHTAFSYTAGLNQTASWTGLSRGTYYFKVNTIDNDDTTLSGNVQVRT